MSATTVRIATRASQLALWQARHVAQLIQQLEPSCNVELVEVSTLGDRDQTEPLSHFGGMGVFTREIQAAVLDGRADVAVHSLKDLPTEPVPGLVLAGVPERGSVADVLVLPASSQDAEPIALDDTSDPLLMLRPQARIGTGSVRRQAQLLHARPDLQMLEIRGNVETRLRKLDAGEYDALVLAAAGLERLNLEKRISARLGPPLVLHAVGQGALGLECRVGDENTRELLSRLTDEVTLASITAERRLLAKLRGGCHAPIGVSTSISEGHLKIEGVVLSASGDSRLFAHRLGAIAEADRLGDELAAELLGLGADRLIAGSALGE